MKNSSFLKALSLSVAALALNVGTAHALTPIYGGGSTLSYNVDDIIGQCAGTQNSSYTGGNKAIATAAGCTAPVNSAFEYLFAGTGSGAALSALVTETSTTAAASGNPQDTGNNFTYPYASWELSFSDAPLDSADVASTVTPAAALTAAKFLDEYNASFGAKTYKPATGPLAGTTVIGGGGRGAAWQIPVMAVPVAIPYHLPSATFGNTIANMPAGSATAVVSNSLGTISGPSATVSVLQLSTDQMCYIWTQHDSKGKAVTGSYTWDNPIFTGSATASGTIIKYDANIAPASVAGVAITPVHRLDASGTTYLFTLWLKNNCKGYATAGYSSPAVYVSWPSYVTTASTSGSGGMIASVNAVNGGIGYVTPDNVAPTSGKTTPAAFLLAPNAVFAHSSQFVYPGTAGVISAESGVSLPASVSATNTATWGAALNKKFFASANTNGGYPITGLTYVMGYTCYVTGSSNDEFNGVKNYINQLSSAAAASTMVSKGFAPLTSGQYLQEVSLVSTQLTGVTVGSLGAALAAKPPASYGVDAKGHKFANGTVVVAGPKACPSFTSNTLNYK